jgi:pyridoxine 5-phosphate synthase
MMPIARELGADRVELYTEPYAAAALAGREAASLATYAAAARAALQAGLQVNAGHDLNLDNLGPFLAALPAVAEVSIGHALIADALELGLPATIGRYLALCRTHPAI